MYFEYNVLNVLSVQITQLQQRLLFIQWSTYSVDIVDTLSVTLWFHSTAKQV